MELSKSFINLSGLFKTNIENSKFLCSGLSLNLDGMDIKNNRVYELHIQDEISNKTKEVVYIGIQQVSDKLIMGYRQRKFEIISITDNQIDLLDTVSGLPYFIERINISF